MDENFFENLANGKKAVVANEDEGDFEIELAKADTSVSTKKAKAEAWDDGEPEGSLMVDVYQTDADIVVESAMAGVKPEDIDVNVTTDSISIKGARYREAKVTDENYYHQECYWGRFSRSIILPQEVDPESAEVAFKNGILTVRLPKVNKKKTRKLKVRID